MSITGVKSYSTANIQGENSSNESATINTRLTVDELAITALEQTTTGQSYNTGTDTTIIDNNVIINGTLTTIPLLASQTYVNNQISALVASAPASLDTLNELATALGNDENFSTTIINSLADKASLSANQTISGINTMSNSSNTYYGNGANLTGVITTLPSNLMKTDISQNITGINNFTNTENTYYGSFNGTLIGTIDASTIAVADNNTSNTYYPTFCSTGAGQKSLLFDIATGPLSYVPSSGNLRALQYTIGTATGSNNSLLYQGSSALGIQNNATSGVTNFHTYDASNVLGTRLQISSGGVQANVPLSIFDGTTSDNLFLQATAGGGSWNASTINSSSLIFAKSSAIDLQSLSLTVWSNTNTGVQITPTYCRIGHGGGGTPTSYLQVSSGTTTIEGTTINISSTTTKLQITSSQVQSSVPLIVTDSTTNDELGFNAVTTIGYQNPITQAGSSIIYAKTGTIGNQSLTLTCWNSITSGVFISPIYTTIGYGGTSSIPASNITFTASASTISGTSVNINNNNFQFGTGTTCNVGYGAGAVSNLIIGNSSAAYTTNYTAGQNTVIGNDSCALVTTTFAGNVAVGYGTMNIATSATDCVAIGNLAGSGLTSGSSNTFVGSGAGFQSSTAGTGSSNTCIGNSAGNGIATSANGNTLVGSGCASAMTTSTNNTCLGSNSGDNITTGSSNITVGSFSTVPNPTGNGQIAIGTASDTMYIRGGLNLRNGSQITASISLSAPLPQFVTVNMASASQTITLPAPNNTTLLGAMIIFKRKGNTTAFTISAGAGTPFIPIASITASLTIAVPATVFQVMLVCDGTNWCSISQT